MCPANNTSGASRGYIIPIGGAEEKLNSPDILDRFIEVCGGLEARIGIIPTASELEDTGRNYEKLFRKIGVKHAKVLPFITREDCQTGEDVDYIEKCDGVFMTGGNQLRLSTTFRRCFHARAHDRWWFRRQYAEPGYGDDGARSGTDQRLYH